MFSQIFSQKQRIHKQQDQLYRVLLFCLFLFSPVFLLLSPLPSFLIYQGTDNNLSHLIGWLIITVICLFECYLFLSVWQQKELLFFKYLFGKNYNKNLLLTFFQYSILLHFCIWAGYFKVDWSLSNLALTASMYIYSTVIFIALLKFKLTSNIETKTSWPNIKTISFILLNGNFTSIILLIIGSYFSLTLIYNVEKYEVVLFIATLWLALNSYLLFQVSRSIKKNQNKISLFLQAISPNYYKNLCRYSNLTFFASAILILVLNIVILSSVLI